MEPDLITKLTEPGLNSGIKKTVFLTGPDGILGNNLIPLLINRGYQVRALIQPGRSPDFTRSLGADTVFGDVLNRDEIIAVMSDCEYLIHAAANTNI
jgi:dihydroflavonol-4-reductase